jgi:hypothetical protein
MPIGDTGLISGSRSKWGDPGKLVAEVPFRVGAQGLLDGLAGSPERQSYALARLSASSKAAERSS